MRLLLPTLLPFVLTSAVLAQPAAAPPKVALIGDSIRKWFDLWLKK